MKVRTSRRISLIEVSMYSVSKFYAPLQLIAKPLLISSYNDLIAYIFDLVALLPVFSGAFLFQLMEAKLMYEIQSPQ